MFKLWSEQNNEAKKLLNPDLGLRSWDDISHEDKDKIWHFLSNRITPHPQDVKVSKGTFDTLKRAGAL